MFPSYLSNDYPLENHLFFVTLYSFRLFGLYFEEPQTFWSLVYFCFNFINLTHGCQAQLYYGLHYLTIRPVDAMDAFCPLACGATTLVKLCCILYSRKEVLQLMQRIRVLTEHQNEEEHRRLKRGYYNLATRSGMIILWLGILTSVVFMLRSFWELLENWSFDPEVRFETPFRMIFPNSAHRLPLYLFTFFYSGWVGMTVTFAFTGTDGFFFSFTLYVSFLLKALQMDVQRTLKKIHEPNAQDCELCCQRLTNIIDRHNEIVDIVHKFSRIMAAPTFVHFLSASLVIAMSVVDILLLSGYFIIRYVIYFLTVSSAIFLYCYGGTEMATESLQLGEVAYSSEWYCWDREVRKRVYLLILRAQTPITVKVPFFAPSLPVFASVIQFTGSIVALVKTVI